MARHGQNSGRARGSETRKGSAFGGEQLWMGAEGGVQQKRTQN